MRRGGGSDPTALPAVTAQGKTPLHPHVFPGGRLKGQSQPVSEVLCLLPGSTLLLPVRLGQLVPFYPGVASDVGSWHL